MRIMRKSINILLSILLSILIVWIGSGIMTMVCEHTGNVSLAQQMEKKNCKNSDAKALHEDANKRRSHQRILLKL